MEQARHRTRLIVQSQNKFAYFCSRGLLRNGCHYLG